MTDTSVSTATQQIVTALVSAYQRHGYTGVAVPAGSLLSVVPREQLEQALAAMLDAEALVPLGANGIALHPSARTALLTRQVLDQWTDKVSRETGHVRDLYRDTIAAELRALSVWAAGAPALPDELVQRAAELAGVAATHGLDPRSMEVVSRHGGTARARLAALVAVAPGSCAGPDQLLALLRNSVSTTMYPSR
jgi:hypothetical protein